MIGKCFITINEKEIGVLFGVRIFQIIQDEKLKMSEDEKDQMNFVHTVWAGIKNYCDLNDEICATTKEDVYLLMNNNIEEFTKALECFASSKTMGKPVKELSEEVKKKTKKRSLLSRIGRLFQRTA